MLTPQIAPFTVDKVDDVLPIHRDAFSGYLTTRLGVPYMQAFLRWFATHPDCTISLVAELPTSGKVIGYVCGVEMSRDREATLALQPHATKGLMMRPWLVFEQEVRRKVTDRVRMMLDPSAKLAVEPPVLPEPVMGLIGIGVSSEARGLGAGRLLMEAFETRSRALNMKSMLLSVYPRNTGARRLYERQGWEVPPGDPFEGRALYYAKTLD